MRQKKQLFHITHLPHPSDPPDRLPDTPPPPHATMRLSTFLALLAAAAAAAAPEAASPVGGPGTCKTRRREREREGGVATWLRLRLDRQMEGGDARKTVPAPRRPGITTTPKTMRMCVCVCHSTPRAAGAVRERPQRPGKGGAS